MLQNCYSNCVTKLCYSNCVTKLCYSNCVTKLCYSNCVTKLCRNFNSNNPIPVAAQAKACVCGLSFVRISSSNPAGGMVSVCYEFCVESGRGLCVGLITRREEFYRVWCV